MKSFPNPPANGVNQWLPSAARWCKNAGYSQEQAIALINTKEELLRGGRYFQPNEIERAVARIYSDQMPLSSQRSVQAIEFDPNALAILAAKHPEAQSPCYFKARSPVPVGSVCTERYLHLITRPGEKHLCFRRFKSQGQFVFENTGDPCQTGGYLSHWYNVWDDGAWFLPQPVTGEFTPKLDGKETRRSEANVTSFRFLLLESDVADKAHWLSMLAQLPLPIVSITDSGGKSVHALVLINAHNKAEWLMRVFGEPYGPLIRHLGLYGVDSAAIKALQLTRLPGVHRGKQFQELLYLNLEPDGSPITNQKPHPTLP